MFYAQSTSVVISGWIPFIKIILRSMAIWPNQRGLVSSVWSNCWWKIHTESVWFQGILKWLFRCWISSQDHWESLDSLVLFRNVWMHALFCLNAKLSIEVTIVLFQFVLPHFFVIPPTSVFLFSFLFIGGGGESWMEFAAFLAKRLAASISICLGNNEHYGQKSFKL